LLFFAQMAYFFAVFINATRKRVVYFKRRAVPHLFWVSGLAVPMGAETSGDSKVGAGLI
jgi:hypothetical protein